MGWGTGSELMDDVIRAVEKEVKSVKTQERLFAELIGLFEHYDADTLDECLGSSKAFDRAYYWVQGTTP